MKVGCGFVEKTVHGQKYIYLWSFQVRANGMRKVERYVGPAKRPDVRERALRELDAYGDRAAAELARRRARWRRQLGGP